MSYTQIIRERVLQTPHRHWRDRDREQRCVCVCWVNRTHRLYNSNCKNPKPEAEEEVETAKNDMEIEGKKLI